MKMELRNGRNSLTRLIMGIMLCGTAIMTLLHSHYWGLLAGFLGITNIISAITGFCLMEKFLSHVFGLPVKKSD